MLEIIATDAPRLNEIEGEIHDWFFDLDDIQFDSGTGKIVIPFRRWDYDERRLISTEQQGWFRRRMREHWEAPWYRWFLSVGRVDGYELVDEADVGQTDFCSISYDAIDGTLTIQGCQPVTLTASVRALEVSLRETAEVIGTARFSSGPGLYYDGAVYPPS